MGDLIYYDQWKLDNGRADEEVFGECDVCEEEIFVGEHYIELDDAEVHEECFTSYAFDALDAEVRIAGE